MTESVMVRRSLGRRLKALRLHAGKTAADVGTAGIASRAKLARIESGVGGVKMADVRALCWLYGVDRETTDTLAELALSSTGAGGWWETYRGDLPHWFSMFVELESAATSVSLYEPELVCGILQTPDYQRAIFATGPRATEEIVERQVELRTARQRAAFERDQPLRVCYVANEGVLLREVGGPDVMAAQRQHLRDLAREPHCEVFVLPWSVGAHSSMSGSYALLRFEGDDPDVLYFERSGGASYVEDAAPVRDYADRFAQVRALSIPIEEYLR